jgi:hypothetical protein
VSTSYLPTISDLDFSVGLAGGGLGGRKFPQAVFAKDLDLLGEPGCERGYIVYQVPIHRHPGDLRFMLDYSHNDPQGYTNSTKVRFRWTL